MNKKSIYAQMLALPVDHPRHQQFRSGLWIVGEWFESHYYLSILTGQNYLDGDRFHLVRQALIDYVTASVSAPAGRFLAACRQPECVAHDFLKYQLAEREGWAKTTRWSKGQRLMILLFQHPGWSDEQFTSALNTTAKQLQRLNTWFDVARSDAARQHGQTASLSASTTSSTCTSSARRSSRRSPG